jgi:alkanesulfonate monooxygenase SsuD/methylene tetrahydromethanopterin reductase-like flavin-dependent oxidoreductase (luciferase family)
MGVHVGQQVGVDDVRAARLLQELGFDAAWLGDGIWSPSGMDAGVLAPVLLQATERIHVGVNVFNVAIRYPQSLARIAATTEALFPGRFVLGLGAGYHKRLEAQEQWGFPQRPDADRVAYFQETAAYLDQYFRAERVTFEGEFVRTRDARGSPFPGGRRPRLLIGGGRPSVLRVAARYADLWDGMAIWNFGAADGEQRWEYFDRKLAELSAYCRSEGRDPGAITTCMTAYVALAARRADAQTAAEAALPFIPYRPAVAGTPDDLNDFCATAVRHGVKEFQIVPVGASSTEALLDFIRLLGRDSLPALRSMAAASEASR